jgi:hypothetical protein
LSDQQKWSDSVLHEYRLGILSRHFATAQCPDKKADDVGSPNSCQAILLQILSQTRAKGLKIPWRARGLSLVEHSKLQSKRSNPNARWQLGVRKEAAPSPPNHGGDEFLTCPRHLTIVRAHRGCLVSSNESFYYETHLASHGILKKKVNLRNCLSSGMPVVGQ